MTRGDVDAGACVSCGGQLVANARFCRQCGAPAHQSAQPTEYR
jgi:predicted amidophosphoribosyltransferase